MNLSEDIISLINPKTIYGRQGDPVGVISYHGSVAIVENIHGERFPVKASLLTSIPHIKKNEVAVIESPSEKKPETKTPARKKIKVSVSDAIPNLF